MCVIKKSIVQGILKWLTIEWILIFALEKSGHTDLKISIYSVLTLSSLGGFVLNINLGSENLFSILTYGITMGITELQTSFMYGTLFCQGFNNCPIIWTIFRVVNLVCSFLSLYRLY